MADTASRDLVTNDPERSAKALSDALKKTKLTGADEQARLDLIVKLDNIPNSPR